MIEDSKYAIDTEIEEVNRCYKNPPPNEAATCEWVILPILHSIGYSRTDIIPQASNAINQYPDYTLLENTPFTWYLEVKDWKQNLDNNPNAAIQALNYANTHGRRWVVLSNGREWILYDNHIQGVAISERISARSEINSPNFIDFILALSKESIRSGGLDLYTYQWRLKKKLQQQLVMKDSSLIKAIQRILRSENGLGNVQSADIAQYFVSLFESINGVPITNLASLEKQSIILEKQSGNVKTSILNLAEMHDMREGVCYHHVDELYLPNKNCIKVKSWCDAAIKICEFIIDSGSLQVIPFKGLAGGKRWFINTLPSHEDGKEMKYHVISNDGKDLYIDINRSSNNFVTCLCNLCDASNVAKTDIKLKITPNDK